MERAQARRLRLLFLLPYLACYTTSPLDGMARNYYYYFYLHGYARSRNLSCLDQFNTYLLIPEERKNIWSELEPNPGPLASQATALTTRPWLLGLFKGLWFYVVFFVRPIRFYFYWSFHNVSVFENL